MVKAFNTKESALRFLETANKDCIGHLFKNEAQCHEIAVKFVIEGILKKQKCIYFSDERYSNNFRKRIEASYFENKKSALKNNLKYFKINIKNTKADDYIYDPLERIKKQIKPSVKNDRGLRVLINLTSLKNFTEFNKLILSSKLNSFCLKNNILLLCQFDMSQLTSTDLLEILKTHRYIIESDEVVNNNFYSNPAEHLSQIRIEREKIHLLSNREIKILKLIVNGLSSKKISEELNISHRTVDTHRLSIMKKLDLNSVVDLVKFSLRNGLA